ncbi:hypothetical protein HYU14_04760 [Candidatus Woesearchaeota archaeon]|nr:hypothetical protein [Candidatus Woesearchaeota archaeon]
MSVFDKMMFWKKKDDFLGDLGKGMDFGKGMDLGKGPDLGLGGGLGSGLGPESGSGMGDFGKSTDMFGAGQGRDMGLGGNDLNFGNGQQQSFGSESGFQPGYPGRPAPMQQPFGPPLQQVTQQHAPELYGKDLEVVSAKLDSIRYTLESINQRLANLERMANGEYEQKRRW